MQRGIFNLRNDEKYIFFSNYDSLHALKRDQADPCMTILYEVKHVSLTSCATHVITIFVPKL